MHQLLRTLWREEDGQDMMEYSLLIAFIVIVTAGVMSLGGDSIKGMVNASNTELETAQTAAGI